jgi:hypothetical protein
MSGSSDLAFAVVFAFALFPPWVEIVSIGDGASPMHRKLWHAPLWRNSIDEEYDAEVDYPRMFTEIAVSECFVAARIWCGDAEVAGLKTRREHYDS